MKKLIISIAITIAAIAGISTSVYYTGKSKIKEAIIELRSEYILDNFDEVNSYTINIESIDDIVKEPYTGKSNLYAVFYTYSDSIEFTILNKSIKKDRKNARAFSLIEFDGLSVKALGYNQIEE